MRRHSVPPGYYIYTWSYPDGTPFYVGIGYGGRAFNTVRNRLVTAIRKKIESDGGDVLVETTECKSRGHAMELEVEFIVRHGRRDIGTGILANMTDGGEGGPGHIVTEEHRRILSEKTSESKRGNTYTKGRPLSDAQKASLREARTGTTASQETRDKMSIRRRGVPKSDAHRQAISAAMLARRQK